MLNYTFAAVDKTVKDLKRVSFYVNILVNALYILYLIYALAVGTGNPVVNAVLCALTAVFFVSFIVASIDEEKKKTHKRIKITYKRIKLFIDAFSLAIAIYSIYIAAERATVISILLTVASLIGWISKVTLSIAINFIEARANLLLSALHMDFDPLIKAKNAYKFIVGDELTEDVPEQTRAELEALKNNYESEKKAKKKKRSDDRRRTRRERFEAWRKQMREKKKKDGLPENGDGKTDL